jgi:hypothetical protein
MNTRTSITSEDPEFYARHLAKLLDVDVDSLWVRRRVINCTVVDGETLRINVSIDFDLTACEAGRTYLADIEQRGSRRPVLIPIGLYRDPLIGFDLRDSGDSRISFIAKKESDEITKFIKDIKDKERDKCRKPLLEMTSNDELAIGIAEYPSDAGAVPGRGVLHYTYLRRWRKDLQAFPFLPSPSRGLSNLYLRRWSKEWWRRQRMLLGWHPMRVVIPLWNMRYSQSCHVELQTPEGIRIHQPGIFAEDVGRKQVEMSGNIPNKEAPPCHNHTIAHYEKLKKEHPDLADNTLAFRAWLSLDRRLVGAILFLAVFNLIVSASTVVVFLFMQINMSNFVTVQALAAAAVFAYLYAPTEHGLSRGLYAPVRRTSVWIAVLGLAVALDLSLLEPRQDYLREHFPAWGTYPVLFVVAAVLAAFMFFMTVVLGISFVKVKDKRVRTWLDRQWNGDKYWQFGWHIEG